MTLYNYVARTERATLAASVNDCVTLSFEQRQKTRLRVLLDRSKQEVGVHLPRGTTLRDGDLLRADDSSVLQIIAADEAVSIVLSDEAAVLARIAYHLGNRHVRVQVGDGWIGYLQDHVLDQMLIAMGHKITHQQKPFEAESGAYGHGAHHDHATT